MRSQNTPRPTSLASSIDRHRGVPGQRSRPDYPTSCRRLNASHSTRPTRDPASWKNRKIKETTKNHRSSTPARTHRTSNDSPSPPPRSPFKPSPNLGKHYVAIQSTETIPKLCPHRGGRIPPEDMTTPSPPPRHKNAPIKHSRQARTHSTRNRTCPPIQRKSRKIPPVSLHRFLVSCLNIRTIAIDRLPNGVTADPPPPNMPNKMQLHGEIRRWWQGRFFSELPPCFGGKTAWSWYRAVIAVTKASRLSITPPTPPFPKSPPPCSPPRPASSIKHALREQGLVVRHGLDLPPGEESSVHFPHG